MTENLRPIKFEKFNLCKQSGFIKRARFKCSKYQAYFCVLSDSFINFHGVEVSIVRHFGYLYADFADECGFVFHFSINLYKPGKMFVVESCLSIYMYTYVHM